MPPVLFDIRTRNRIRLERVPDHALPFPPWVIRHLWDLGDPDDLVWSARVDVCCEHGRRKGEIRDLIADTSREHVHGCPCCRNLYAKPSDEPGPCPACVPTTPRSA